MSHCPSSMLRVTIAFLALVLQPLGARAQSTEDEAVDKITQLNKDAITAYQAKKYQDAQKILKEALDIASSAGLDDHPVAARTHIHLGIVIIVGLSQRDLGIKQFRKALEIEPEIKLTRALVTPDLADAFAEAKMGGTAPPSTPPTALPETRETKEANETKPAAPPETKETNEPKPAAPPATPAIPASPAAAPAAPAVPAASPPPREEGPGRLTHEAATEAKQGSAISITVGVPGDVRARRAGADADADTETDADTDDKNIPDNRYFVGLMVGAGFGWATGEGDTNADVAISPARLAPAGVGHFGPEVGYWVTSSLMLSGQLRYEYITGTTYIYATHPMHTYLTANYALALFAKATWKYGEGKFHPFFSLAAGGGRIRHVVTFRHENLANCGPNHNETCVDTIGAGPVLLGPGAGFMYDVSDRAALVVQVNSVLGVPTFTVNLDANVGVAFRF